MSSDGPVADMTEGGLTAAWEISKKEIKSLVTRFRNKKLLFINEQKTIDEVCKQRKSTEFKTFKGFIENLGHRALVATGMGSRHLPERQYRGLISDVRKAHGNKGVAIIHCISNGLLSRFFTHLISMDMTQQKIKYEFNDFLNNIDKRTAFIESTDNYRKRAKTSIYQINAHQPIMYLISSVKGAIINCKKTAKFIKREINGYIEEIIKLDKPKRRIHVFIRDDTVSDSLSN